MQPSEPSYSIPSLPNQGGSPFAGVICVRSMENIGLGLDHVKSFIPGESLGDASLSAGFSVIDRASSIKPPDKIKAAAQLIWFHQQFKESMPKIIGVETEHDVDIPGTDYRFHFRTDLETENPFSDDPLMVWDYKTIALYQTNNKAALTRYWSHSFQVAWYCWALGLPFMRMLFLPKPTTRTSGKSIDQVMAQVMEEMSEGVWAFTIDVYPNVPASVIQEELMTTVENMECIKEEGKSSALKNRSACKSCGFQPVCSESEFYLNDPEHFVDKIPAHEDGKYISVSQAGVFHSCNRKWFHSYVDLKKPVSFKAHAMAYGAVVHDALEAWGKVIKEEQNG